MTTREKERSALTPPPHAQKGAEKPKYRIWAMHCPFMKTGSPVLGTFGANVRSVVIFEVETWKRLCQDVPQLQTTMFEVGSYED